MSSLRSLLGRRFHAGRSLGYAVLLLMCGAVALAQGPGPRGGGQGPPMGGGMPPQPWPQQGRGMPPGPPQGGGGMTQSTLRGGMQLGPPGLWWDDPEFSRSIGLVHDQQRRMDAIFNANKSTLQSRYKDLQHEEIKLEKLTRAKALDEKQIFAQIDRVVQARGELEKANAHMLLAIREEMTPDQVERLDSHRPEIPQPQ
jgi:hypothetical protein